MLVRRLDEVGATDLALVGGKGANLGELVAAGIPVPMAFCVTTQAYRAVLAQGDLPERIHQLLAQIDYDDPAGIESSAVSIRSLILESDVPQNITAAVSAAYAQLESTSAPNISVSVRSSATAEDLPGMSFAGQQDTYLHISGETHLLEAIKQCWASLWTDRAIAYRHNQQFDHDQVYLAVVVQEMFPSEVSGVMFTANPVTSNPEQYFVNASWGLGEAVVSGLVNPDQLILAKADLSIVDRKISEKLVMTVPSPEGQGSIESPVPKTKQGIQSLDDARIRELCRIGQTIEAHYGFPQDIEWGWANGRFSILQAREITGANLDFCRELESWKSPNALADMYDDRWLWSRAYSDEVQTGPSTPSFYTSLQLGMTRLKVGALAMTGNSNFLEFDKKNIGDFPFFRWYGARAYYNLDFERERIRRFIPPFARDDAALWPFPVEQRDEIRDMPFDWASWLGLMRSLHENKYDVSLLGSTAVIYEGLERWTNQEIAFWKSFNLGSASVEEIFKAQLESRKDSRFGENVILPFSIYLYMLPQALQLVCAKWLGDSNGTIYNQLVGGLQSKTSEENIAVWALSREIRSSARLTALVQSKSNNEVLSEMRLDSEGQHFLATLKDFVAQYGHRGGAERDAYHLRWHHDPGLVFDSIRPFLGIDDDESPAAHEKRLREQMLQTKAESVEQLSSQPLDAGRIDEMGWLVELYQLTGERAQNRGQVFGWFVELVQDYFYYRDYERFFNDHTMSRSRELYLAIAHRLIEAGLMKHQDDVFFLGRDEMLAADSGGLTLQQIDKRVSSRRRVYERYTNQEPPKYIRGWQTFDDDQLGADGALVGIGASNGVVTGRARVCRSLEEIARIEKGDILVTVATDPGWTTVFSIIAGVVVETGGVVAHAVMISREYGLPCVSNLERACDQIPDGATISVDGTTGAVLVHDEETVV